MRILSLRMLARLHHRVAQNVSWRRIAQVVLVSVAILYLAQRVILDASKLSRFEWKLRLIPLMISYVMLLTALVAFPLIWWLLLRGMGGELSPRKAFRIWYISNLGRYIPGKIWQIVGRVELAKNEGVARATCAASVLYEMGLFVTSGMLVFGTVVATSYGGGHLTSVRPVLVLLPLGIVFSHPRVFSRAINVVLRMMKKQDITIKMGAWRAMSILALYGSLWIILGIGFHFLISSLTEVPFEWLPQLTGVFSASWIAGFLSFLSPGGLGVREGVMAFLLGFYLPPSVSAVVSVLSRIWITIGEILCVVVSSRAGTKPPG